MQARLNRTTCHKKGELMDLSEYQLDGFYDELFAARNVPHSGAKLLIEKIASLSLPEFV
jgi:hypothetical protein